MPAAKKPAEPAPFSSLAAKLSYIQGHVANVEKSGWNEHHKFKFVQEHGMFEVLRPLLRECNVAVVISPATHGVTKDGQRTILHGTLTLLDGDSEQTISASFAGEGQDTQDKGTAKAQTHFVKYALQKFFMIPTQAIDDSDNDEASAAPAKAAPPAAAPADGKCDPAQAAEVRELATHYITEEKTLDPNKLKGKLATYRVSALEDLSPTQLQEIGEWIGAQVTKARAAS